jgi:putative addiction module component (TIGR02574 family)
MQLNGDLNMAVSREELFRQALQLNESERATLAGMLIDSIDSEVEEGVEAAWMAEIERRIEQLDAGMAETIPWDVVRDGLRRRLGG